VHAEDAAAAIAHTIERPTPGCRTFNIATGVGTSFKELAAMIVDIADSESRIEDSITDAPGRDLVADINRARADLGYAPRVPLRDGLERYVAWLRHDSA
jgi:nucleoside-diphosphate-sugar epimerase